MHSKNVDEIAQLEKNINFEAFSVKKNTQAGPSENFNFINTYLYNCQYENAFLKSEI